VDTYFCFPLKVVIVNLILKETEESSSIQGYKFRAVQGATLTFQLTSLVARDNLDVTGQKLFFY